MTNKNSRKKTKGRTSEKKKKRATIERPKKKAEKHSKDMREMRKA